MDWPVRSEGCFCYWETLKLTSFDELLVAVPFFDCTRA
jgi:hypothetical protein